MGLDTVELVMSVEEEFDVVIQLDDYGQLRTVGDLCAYIAQQKRVETLCLHPAAFVHIRRALMSQFGLQRQQVRIATDLEELFPIAQRRQLWDSFGSALGLRIPTLRPAPEIRQSVCCWMIAFAVGSILLAFLEPFFLFGAVLTPLVAFAVMALIEARFALTFAMPQPTVGGLTRSVAALNAGTLSTEVQSATDDEAGIWPRLRRVVSRSLSIPEEQIFLHSRFVEELFVD